jgi:hypothetical protein
MFRSGAAIRLAARWSSLCALLAIAALVAPRASRAEERRERTRRAQLVVVDYPSSAFIDPGLHAAVRELLSRVQVQVVSAAQAADGEVIAYAQIAVGGDEVEIRVEDARGRHAPARRSLLRGGSDAMLRETVAHVLLGLIEPLAEADRHAPEQALRAGEDAGSGTRRAWQLGLHGGPVQLAQGTWSARFVGSGALVWGGRFSPSLALDASIAVPVTVNQQGVEAQVLLAGARARARLTPLAFTHAAVDAALSAGADVFVVRPEHAADGTELSAGASRRGQPVLGLALGVRTRVHPRLELVLGLGFDFDPMPRRWAVDEGESSSMVFETRYVRPYATLGVDWLPHALPTRPALQVSR